MPIYALDDIDDAIDATTGFLLPFDARRWATLAAVTFFLGGAGGANPLQFGGGSPGGGAGSPGVPETMPSIGAPETAVIAAVLAVVGVLAIGFMLVSAIMEFVFVESLRREAVRLRRYWGEHWGRGLRLFAFRLVVNVITLAVIGTLLVVLLAPILFGDGGFSFGLLAIALPVGVVVAIVSGLLQGFTTMFVVPVMLAENRGVVSAWRRFWPTMTGQWKQYAAYAVMGYVLQLAAGIAAMLVTVIAVVLVAIPTGILGVLGVALRSAAGPVGLVVIAVAVLVFVVAVLVVVLLSSVPVKTFLRYYALLVLGDTEEAFDVIPERRRELRS